MLPLFRFFTLGTALVSALAGCANAVPVTSLVERQEGYKWVDTWTSMQQIVEPNNLPPAPFTGDSQFQDATIRQTLHMSIGAPRIRIQISNYHGTTDLPITAASIALPEGGKAGVGGIQTNTLKPLTFSNGAASITIPRGQVAYTDAIDYEVKPQSMISVSLYLRNGQQGQTITGHPGSRTTSWMQMGNQVNAANVNGGSTAHWYFLSGVEAWSPPNTSALHILGDSITDGRGSTDNANNRWPDLLIARMQQAGITKIGVNNQAAGGNRVLNDGLGPSLISRYKRDSIERQGSKYVMVFEGVNDIGTAGMDAGTQQSTGDQLIRAFTQITQDAKRAGRKTFGATITPLGTGYTGGSREQTRQRVNNWIKTSGAFDVVIDFDAAVRDPNNPARLRQQFDGSGDGLHPNVAGFQAMADLFPLAELQETRHKPKKWRKKKGKGKKHFRDD